MEKTQAIFPGVKVLLVSVTPSDRAGETVLRANEMLKGLADNQTVFYIDLYSQMPREGDNWKGVGRDHLHLTQEGYELWASEMEPLLSKLLSSGS